MGSVAIITARGGSKRIPGKNIKEFCGKPVMAYSIEAALDSGLFGTVMVSTDSVEIAETARRFGAEVPFMRSRENSGDFALTEEVLTEVLERYEDAGVTFDHACCIYPAAPFVTAEKLREAWKIIREGGADLVFPVVRYSFPPQRGCWVDGGYLSPICPDLYKARSQDLKAVYHDAGQFYFFDAKGFRKRGSLFGGRTRAMIVDEMEAQDIDSEADWELAEMKYSALCRNQPGQYLGGYVGSRLSPARDAAGRSFAALLLGMGWAA